jgi:hypothetical protein
MDTPKRKRLPPNAGKGRPKGSLNKNTKAIKDASALLLGDKAYQASLKQRLVEGKAPHMEVLLHHYAHGKPKDTVQVDGVIPPFVLRIATDDEPDE